MPPNSALPGRRILLAGMAGSIAASCARPAPADTAARPTDTWPGVGWEYATPEQAGWDTGALAAAHAYAQAIGTATFTVVQHGRMVARWGDVSRKLELHSMRKSLLSALIGIAVTEGRIDLDATLASLGLDDAPPSLTPAEKQATSRELLQSRSGVYHVALYETPGEVAARPDRGSHPPGSFWYYNNWDFNVLGTIYERAAGETIAQAFMARIATPLAMQDYRVTDSRYVRDDAVSLFPAYPFRMSARDLARFGLLYARAGRWRDQAVVPAAWVRDSTRAYSMTTIDSGYGYLWWTGFPDRRVPLMDLPANAFWADGAHGQFICVDPANDLVAVHQTDGSNVSTRQKGHLMWLVQTAARIPDPGSDPNGEVRPGRSGRSRQL